MRLSLQYVSQAQRAAKPTEASRDLFPRVDPDSPGPKNYYRTERGSVADGASSHSRQKQPTGRTAAAGRDD